MKRSSVVLILLILAVLAGFYFLLNGPTARNTGTQEIQTPPVTFFGKTLEVPTGWTVYEFGTRGGTLSLTRHVDSGLAPTLTLEDERQKPEDPVQFVGGWESSLRVPGFHPKSLQVFHDSAVDAAGARCVEMHWDGTQRPYRVICIASNGRWKLTLSGEESDVAGIDGLASQLPAFVRGL